ncbi:MAG: prolyl oligopeptidase family serine peptidase [Planctomyces sp.]|nr:prolyl oligopeptidase family serine peptidase [Planctomyces sp.]
MLRRCLLLLTCLFTMSFLERGQVNAQHPPAPEVLHQLERQHLALRAGVEELRQLPLMETRSGRHLFADVAIFEKAAEWMLRHEEFYQPAYIDQLSAVIELGRKRAEQLRNGRPYWGGVSGKSYVCGFVSRVDGSVQPYALTLPEGISPADSKRWPLHVVLHGRANEMNEVNFIFRHEKDARASAADWIQLDVYGRGSNAYRWAGETDVFEAIADVKSRFRIDENRVTLHGFSMGGAGAWHLGMHYPHIWSSVGPGAGFVDFYKYQKKMEQLPLWQHRSLGIYDAVDYALNASNVPVCTYGGELDPQLLASTTMRDAAAELGVSIKVIIGPGMGHKFDEASLREFMAFHIEKSAAGKPMFNERREIRFTTRTLRYNSCDWVTIEEVEQVYEPSTIEARIQDDGTVQISAQNVSAFRVSRDIAEEVKIEGKRLPCRSAADGLLPDVYYQRGSEGWDVVGYAESRAFSGNPERHKRHGLQGPIDDAFMDSFLCVRGTGTAWSSETQAWSDQIREQFSKDFDFWMRGRIPVIDDRSVTDEMIADNNIILFGDPGSNSVLSKLVGELPIEWTKELIQAGNQEWSTSEAGLSLIYPNPLNPRRYVVINSGYTMTAADFKSSNAWLFPRLGDIAIRRLKVQAGEEEILWAEHFDSSWKLPSR